MAVHLDIRPRLTLPPEPRVALRRRFRLPPLALPAVGYWIGMAGLTYAFTLLGPNPLDTASTRNRPNREPTRALEPGEPGSRLDREPPSRADAVSAPAPPPASEPAAWLEPQSPPSRVAADAASRREDEQPAPPATVTSSKQDVGEPRSALAPPPPARSPSFPEFTDSSLPVAASHAADGPRIDSLFERADQRPDPPDSRPSQGPVANTAPQPTISCEAAIARNNEQLTIGAARGPADVTREAYAAILQNGRYLAACPVPDRTVFEICAAVKDGRAIGITIASNPHNLQLDACVRKAVAGLKFPVNPRLDVTHTRFEAGRR